MPFFYLCLAPGSPLFAGEYLQSVIQYDPATWEPD